MGKNKLIKLRGQSVKDITDRRNLLKKIIGNAKAKKKKLSRQYLLDELLKGGFKVDMSTLYKDRTFISQSNTFIEDITVSNYSGYMQDIWDNLEWVEQQAQINYEKKWTNSKVVYHESADGEISEERHVTDELAAPKSKFLEIFRDTQKIKMEFLQGKNVHLSAALLRNKFDSLNDEISDLRGQLDAAKAR